MTKLNVVIPAVNVMVEIGGSNVEFRKVDRKAQAGDIVKALVSSLDVEAGAFYALTIDEHDAAYFLDDAGDVNGRADSNGYPEEFEVYAPVSAVTTELPSAAEITFENAQYRKVDRSAREGDVIILRSAPFEEYDITQGTPYEVTRVDSSDDPHIKDDEGGDYDTCDDVFDVYEKVSVSYVEVKRKAAVGERIKIVDTVAAFDYGIGDEFVTFEVGADGGARFRDNAGERNTAYLREYVVLEPVNSQAKAENKAEPARLTVGDFAKVIGRGNVLLEVGDIVKLTAITGGLSDAFDIADVLGNPIDGCKLAQNLTPATAEEVSAAQAQAQRKAAVGPFADGGFAQIIDRTKSLAMSAADTDGYVKVSVEPDGRYALSLRKPNGDFSGYCNADALRQITEEEYNATIATKPKFSVGGKIRITRSQCNWPVGTIATITEVLARPNHDSGTVRASADGQSYLADGYAFAVLTAEEAAAIEKEAQKAEEKRREELKWAKLGRKVNEYKTGDVVEVIDSGSSNYAVGLIDTVVDDRGIMGRSLRLSSGKDGLCPFISPTRVKLIVPVGQRFDIVESEAQSAA